MFFRIKWQVGIKCRMGIIRNVETAKYPLRETLVCGTILMRQQKSNFGYAGGEFMKNKSKLNKIKQNNRKPAIDVPAQWFYMSAAECTAGAIREALADTACEVEYWEAAQVLEIVLGEGSSMDVEVLEPDFQDEYSNAFCSLQSDINSAEVNQLKNTEQAWYLREKYLGMERV